MENMQPGQPLGRDPSRPLLWWETVLVIAVLAITFLAYLPVLRGQYVWDDQQHFEFNLMTRSLNAENLREIFRTRIFDNYVPLTILSFALEYHFFGSNPFIYHLDNLLLHLGIVWLVFIFGQRIGLSRPAALTAGLVFGIHPLHVETVAWVSARKDLLYAFFYLLAVDQYWRFISRGDRRAYLFSLGLGLLSMLAKPMAVSLPLVLLLCDWYQGRRVNARVLLEKVPYALYIVPLAWITYSANVQASAGAASVSATTTVLVWTWTLVFYLRKFFVPHAFFPLVELPEPISLSNWHYGWPLAALSVLILMLLILRRCRLLWFAVLYFLASIFFLLRTNPATAGMNPVADRYAYLPVLGFCLLTGWGLERLWQWARARDRYLGRLLALVLGLGVVILSVLTTQQARKWQDAYSLWPAVLARQPASAVAHYNLGLAYLEDGLKGQALQHLLDAVRLRPDYVRGYNNLGNLYFEQGQIEEARRYYRLALQFDPAYVETHSNFGVLLMEEKDYDAAEPHLLAAVAARPRDAQIIKNLGNLYLLKGELAAARARYERVLELLPGDLYAHGMLGEVAMRQQDWSAARQHLSEVLLFEPNNAGAHSLLGTVLLRQGDTLQAIQHLREAVRLNPGDAQARLNLEAALAIQPPGQGLRRDF